MFRIKTDIRQFNCETREKVEKLIRSWVIRPTDLMLDESLQTWSPIGQHEEFAPIFEDIKDLSDVEDLSAEAPDASDNEGGTANMLEQDLDEMEQELAQLEQEVSDAPGAQVIGKAGILKLRALKHGEEPPAEPLPIPVAPDGVEGVAEADEPTIMTERTADLLGVLDEEPTAEPLPIPVAPDGVEGVAQNEEATQVFAREDEEDEEEADESVVKEEREQGITLSSEEVSDASSTQEPGGLDEGEESAPRLGRHDLPEELFLTNELTRSELVSPLEPLRDDLRNAEGGPEEDEETEAWEVTQQIESPLEQEKNQDPIAPNGDDLPLPIEGLDGVSLALSEAAESDIHSEWESMMQLDELRETDEFNVDEHLHLDTRSDASGEDAPSSLSSASSSPLEDTLDLSQGLGFEDTADFNADDIFAAPTAAPPSLEAGQDSTPDEEDDDEPQFEIEEIEREDSRLIETSSPSMDSAEEEKQQEDAIEAPDDAPSDDGIDEAIEQSLADDEKEGGDEARSTQSTEPLFQEPADFVSEGYAMPLPFEIRPSDEDVRQGLKRSTASQDEKDLAFPRPQPKKLKQLVKRRYGYGDPPSERVAAARAAAAHSPAPSTAKRSSSPSTARTASSAPPKDYSRIVAIFALILIVLIIATLIIISK